MAIECSALSRDSVARGGPNRNVRDAVARLREVTRRWITLAIALGVLVSFAISMRTVMREPDGTVIAAYGFPLAWYWPFLGSSLEWQADLGAYAIDVALAITAVVAVLAPARRGIDRVLRRAPWLVRLPVVLATLQLILVGTLFWAGIYNIAPPLEDDWVVQRREITFGALLGSSDDLRR